MYIISDIVIAGEMLTDKHINFAQALLCRKFKSIAGLQSTLTLHIVKKIAARSAPRVLQIIHCRGCHWIVTSTVGSYPKILVYDSLYSSIDDETLALLKQMFGTKVSVELGNGPKQDGTADCGLFAIATCVSIATDDQPKNFIQQSMCDHLLLCFESFNFTTFPCMFK